MRRCVALTLLCACALPPERGLNRPFGVAVDGAGGVLINDFHNQRLVLVPAEGPISLLGEAGMDRGQLWEVWGLTLDHDGQPLALNGRFEGSLAVTLDRLLGGPPESSVEVFEFVQWTAEGPRVYPLLTEAPHELNLPHTLSRGPAETYLVPAKTGAILRFDAQFKPLASWVTTLGRTLEDISWDGHNLWAVDQDAHQILRLNAAGELLTAFGGRGEGDGQLRFPTGVASCPGRWVAVTDMGNFRVQRFFPDGGPLDRFEVAPVDRATPVQLLDVATDCEHLYLADSKGNRVIKTTPAGAVVQVLDNW